jgi:hypothetical protein
MSGKRESVTTAPHQVDATRSKVASIARQKRSKGSRPATAEESSDVR